MSPGATGYEQYGGRGVEICSKWHTFEGFVEDMGERPNGTTLDRKDPDGNYELSNCRWATKSEQANNTRTNRPITVDGKSMNIGELAKASGMSGVTLSERLKRGWSVERAISEPVKLRQLVLNYLGRDVTFDELAEISGIKADTLRARIRSGWTVELAAITPPDRRNKKGGINGGA